MKIQWTEELVDTFTAIAKAAWATYPTDKDSIHRACLIVLEGNVTPHEDGTVDVLSSNGTTVWHVNGHCTCPNAMFRAINGRCKHRWAKTLFHRILAAQDALIEQMMLTHRDGYPSLAAKVSDSDRAHARSGAHAITAGK